MKLKPLFAILALGLALAGCEDDIQPTTTHPVNNGQGTTVDVLFTDKDGYTVKRFTDNGYRRYYVTPGPARVEYRIQSGKYSRPEAIDTAGARR